MYWLAGLLGAVLLLLGSQKNSKIMIAIGIVLLFGLVFGQAVDKFVTRYDLSLR